MNRLPIAGAGLLALTVFVGCEKSGGGSSGSAASNTVHGVTVQNVAGTWQLKDLTYHKNATINLAQNGQVLAGTVDNGNGRHGIISGTIVSSGLIQMRFTFPAGQTDATLQVTGNTMEGSWVDHRDGTTAEIVGVKK